LVGVGVLCFLFYPHSESQTYYSTAASVIATLYVAIALGVFVGKDASGNDMTTEHWVFMVASSAGLVASLRGLSDGKFHPAWQTRLLTALTVVGVTATILLVGDRLIDWRVSGRRIAVLWTLLFIAVAVVLAIFPF
jgi:hypothetical protein